MTTIIDHTALQQDMPQIRPTLQSSVGLGTRTVLISAAAAIGAGAALAFGPTAATDHPAHDRRRRTAEIRQLPVVVRQGEPIGPVTAGTVLRVRPHGQRVGHRRTLGTIPGVPGAVCPDDHRQVPVTGPHQEIRGTGPDSGRQHRRHHDRLRAGPPAVDRGRIVVLRADRPQHHLPVLGQLVHRPERSGCDCPLLGRCRVQVDATAAASGGGRAEAHPKRIRDVRACRPGDGA